ncbi:uncharacterized protein LOC112592287, partial [Melanaphis sacchari]|uniref:uncharacterized protein LOC112592287 n=1 Tax=Melanaphis sacchari TaxID=742174 RepID=UPI000DC15619
MVRRCIICGNVDGVEGISVHRFPTNDHFRHLWMLFAENNGVDVQMLNPTSALCSRHFVPGVDYKVGTPRRRHLLNTAVPSLIVQNQHQMIAAPDGEQDMDVEIVEVQIDDVMTDVDEEPLAQVLEDIEVVDMLPADAAAVYEFMDVFDVLPSDVDGEFIPIPLAAPRAHVPVRDRPAGVRHQLPEQHDIGPLDAACAHCYGRHFRCEKIGNTHFSTCCNNGQMAITGDRVLGQPPELLIRLLIDDSQVARHFRKEIRRYNNTLAFAAFSTDLNPRRLPGRGPKVFTVHGQVYRRISNDVVRNEMMQPSYCELYFIESGEANRIRMAQQPRQHPLLENLITELDSLLRQINPFAVAFQTMRQVWQREQEAAAADPTVRPRRVTMHIIADPNNDPRRYNPPTGNANEVAVVFVGDDGLPPRNLDLVIYDTIPVDAQHRMQSISVGSPHADPMLYPLFFPYGESGWQYNLRQEG